MMVGLEFDKLGPQHTDLIEALGDGVRLTAQMADLAGACREHPQPEKDCADCAAIFAVNEQLQRVSLKIGALRQKAAWESLLEDINEQTHPKKRGLWRRIRGSLPGARQ